MEKILVVNNDSDTMTLLKIWLEKKAYKVKFTENPHEVTELVREFKPGLIMVDVLQKNVVGDLKKNKETCDVPVLLMTGYTTSQNTADLPINDFIEKPFNLKLLKKKIDKLIQT